MFADDQERKQKLNYAHTQVLEYLEFPPSNFLKVFYNRNSFRLRKYGFMHLKVSKKFFIVDIQVESFKMQDLVKISKLNNDLFYIDTKNVKIYTCDQQFAHWCGLTNGDINSIRFSA